MSDPKAFQDNLHKEIPFAAVTVAELTIPWDFG